MAVGTRTVGAVAPRTPVAAGSAGALRVIKTIWLREVLVYSRDRLRITSALMWPILMLVIFGEGLGNTIGAVSEGINYRQFIFPGMVAMTVLTTSVFSGTSIIWDREFGFLREILVAPISRTAIMLGKLFGGATIAMSQGVVMFIFAPLLGVSLPPLVLIQLVAVMWLMALTLTALGIAMASRAKSVEGFQMVSQLVIMPSMFLSGIFFPVNNVPTWMEVLVKLNPVTYAVAPIRAIALDEELQGATNTAVNVELFGHVLTTVESLAMLAGFGVLILAFAIHSFRRAE